MKNLVHFFNFIILSQNINKNFLSKKIKYKKKNRESTKQIEAIHCSIIIYLN